MNIYLLFQTEYYKVFLNEEDQYYLGRSVALLKRKSPNLSDITPEEWIDFGLVVRIYEDALKKTFGANNFNWSCTLNTAYKNNPPNPQVYWHVRPRYSSSVKVGNKLFKDNLFGSHYQTRRMLILSEDLLSEIANKLRENI